MNALARYLQSTDTTQSEFAERAGLAQWDVNRVVNGERKASVRIARAVVKATDGEVTLTDLRPDLWPAAESAA